MSKSIPFFESVMVFCLFITTPVFPDDIYGSGLFTVEFLGVTHVDISLSPDSFQCVGLYNMNLPGKDLSFAYDSIYCPSGITFSPESEKLNYAMTYITRLYDPQAIYYYDNLFRKEQVVAPHDGYGSSAPANKKLYFIRTPGGGYCALLRIGEYIGGIDRVHFYQVMGSGPKLYKTNLFKIPPYIDITARYVFSGRPDPVFRISDSAAIEKLIHFLYLSTNYLEDPALLIHNPGQVEVKFGIPVFEFDYAFSNCDSAGQKSTVRVGYENIEIEYRSVKKTFADRSKQLEKLIYDIGRTLNPVSLGIAFRTLFPDAAKKEDRIDNAKSRVIRIQYGLKTIGIRIPDIPGMSNISVFDVQGKLAGGTGCDLAATDNIPVHLKGSGVYLLMANGSNGKRYIRRFIVR